MSRTLKVLTLLFLIFMVVGLVVPVLAQSTYPPLVGHLIDGTGRVDSARFETAVAPLVDLSAIPLGIAHDGSGELPYNLYEAQVLQFHGYGVPTESLNSIPGATPLDPNVVAVAIDYDGRNLSVYVGDNWTDEIDQNGINAILDEVAKYAMTDPNQAFEAGFAKAYDLMDPPMARSMRMLTATVVPMIPYALVGILALITLVWFIKKTGQLSKANKEIGLVKSAWSDLCDSFEGGTHHLSAVVEVLRNDYPREADGWTSSFNSPNERMNGLRHELARLASFRLTIFSPGGTIDQAVSAYNNAYIQFQEVEDWIVQATNESKKLEDQKAGAHDLLFRTEPEIERVTGWYEQARQNSLILPDKDRVFGGLRAELESAKQLILYQANGELRGARILENVRVILEALEKAASIVVTTESFGRATMLVVREALLNWSREFPNPDSLSESPLNDLAEAIAQLTDDSSYDDVIPPAQASREGFEKLRQAVDDLMTTLKLRDDAATFLQSQFDRGFKNHVGPLLLESAQALTQGTHKITAGSWTGAANQFGFARAQTESARKRMAYLVELQNINQKRLTELSNKTAEVERYRTATVSPLWATLQKDFAPSNWTEVSDYFSLATSGLALIFDDPNNASDKVSEVNELNDMDHQEFEEAEKLLNDLFRQLQQFAGLLDGVANRHALCVKARDTHTLALDGANKRLGEAGTYRDEHNADITPAVDEDLTSAKKLIAEGRKAAGGKNYVLALNRADAASALAIKALDNAKGQVSEMSRLRSAMDDTKAEAGESVSTAANAISQEVDAVVQGETEVALRKAQGLLAQARTAEAGTGALEDRVLSLALNKAITAYSQASEVASKAIDSLAEDKASYRRLMQEAESAISLAAQAISDASSYCSDHRAGNAGDGELSSARSLLPQNPNHGVTRSSIRSTTANATSAKSKAEQAEREARSAIRRYEAEEERRRQAEAARRRAEEQARQRTLDAARRSSSSNSSSFTRSSGSSSHRTMSGGASGHRKF